MKVFYITYLLLASISAVEGLYIPTEANQVLLSPLETSLWSYLNRLSLFREKLPESVVVKDKLKTKFIVSSTIPRNDFNLWLFQQKNISFQGILNNIGGIGFNPKEVTKGAVIASPSKFKPDYFYQWTRDAALTMGSLIQHLDDLHFESEKYNLQDIIESYIENSYNLQRVPNRSGGFEDLEGLGEPKFLPNGEPFDAHWGRPQRDGPGLRSTTIISYLDLLEKYNKDLANDTKDGILKSKEFIYSEILKPDLEYVAKNWNKNGFDLWEEIDSIHLFTSLTQLRALKDGLRIAANFNDFEFSNYLQRNFDELKAFIENEAGFKQFNLPYLVETPSLYLSNKRSGLDAATLLAAIHAHNVDDKDLSSSIPFDVNDPLLLNTLAAMSKDMKYRYPINHNRINFDSGIGVALGRYPEDIYNGIGLGEGNPWFISTATASEIIFKTIYQLYKFEKDLVIDVQNKEFYSLFLEDAVETNMILPYDSVAFKQITESLFNFADSFLDIIREHVDNYGHMSEQFNKYTGYMEGAEDLTWSYSAIWSSFRWRDKVLGFSVPSTN